MKFTFNSLGKILVAISAVAVIFVLISAVFIPGVRGFVSNIFPSETNYIDGKYSSVAPKLEASSDKVEVAVGSSVDIFANITAVSSDNEDLKEQLINDYNDKTMEEREHVFIYKINADNTSTLVSAIDPSVAGKWAVIYLLNDNSKDVSLKVSYIVK